MVSLCPLCLAILDVDGKLFVCFLYISPLLYVDGWKIIYIYIYMHMFYFAFTKFLLQIHAHTPDYTFIHTHTQFHTYDMCKCVYICIHTCTRTLMCMHTQRQSELDTSQLAMLANDMSIHPSRRPNIDSTTNNVGMQRYVTRCTRT